MRLRRTPPPPADLGPEYRVEYPMNVVLTNVQFRCTKCGQWKPGAKVGLRADGDVVRNQPQCADCRGTRPRLRRVK